MHKYLLAGAALLMAQAASATILTVNGNFTATNWTPDPNSSPSSPPTDPLTLSYKLTFDNTLTYFANTTALTILGGNNPYPLTFSYEAGEGTFVLATDSFPYGCRHFAASLCMFVNNFATGTPYVVYEAPAVGGGLWEANTITAGVPEAATWAMLIAGFGMTGAAMRKRRMAAA